METRIIDWVMLVIEALISAFIVWEFVWKIRDWRKERQQRGGYETEVNTYLSQLDEEEATALSGLALDGRGLPSVILERMLNKNSKRLLARDYFIDWGIAPEHKSYHYCPAKS